MDSLRQKATAGVDSVAAKAKEAVAGRPVDQAVDQAAAQAKTMTGRQTPPAPGEMPPGPPPQQ